MCRLPLAALALVLAAGAAAAQTADRFNPAPDPDDLVFPMPCDARMAFRKVVVPVKAGEGSNWMADTPVTLGDDRDPGTRYAEAPRDLPLVGGFREADPAKQAASFYLIAKYEMTVGQRNALLGIGKDCAAPAGEREMPAVSLAWFDAVELTERYTQWLYENADAKLDKGGELARLVSLNGYFRLPTESEWEYAARGGSAAGKDFRNPTYVPQGEAMEESIWFAGPKSANGKLWPIGLKKPNQLRVHDILGNAAEIVLEPYRMTKAGRLHGQAGGFVVKGGSYLIAESVVGAAWRREYPPVDLARKAPSRVETNGFRMAFAPTVETKAEPQRIARIRQEYEALSALDTGNAPAAPQPGGDPIQQLEALAKGSLDPDTQRRLNELVRSLADNTQVRNEQRDRAANALIRIGALYGRDVDRDRIEVRTYGRLLVDQAKIKAPPKDIAETKQAINDWSRRLDEDFATYREFVKQAAQDYAQDTLRGQLELLKLQAGNPAIKRIERLIAVFVAHTDQHRRSNGRIDADQWKADLSTP